MSRPIEDYALLGDTESAALVGRDGSIDWMCLPRFDSDACFAALIGGEGRGRFRIAPASPVRSTTRRYRPGTLVLETTFATDEGVVRVVDAMPPRDGTPDVARVVEGVRGRVPMRVELAIRFGYGVVVPWIRRRGGGVYTAVGGPDALALQADHAFEVRDAVLGADLTVSAGERVPFRLAWFESHRSVPERTDPIAAIGATERWWAEWTAQSSYRGGWRKHVLRSLVTLKALTHAPTGGIVAAPTTSLPELRGGTRNWDYRYCWLRDATFTLDVLMATGFHEEGQAFCDWLARSVAGDARQIQIMYGVGGERRLTEQELPRLDGYDGSKPVRVGNAAMGQLQLDVFGEVMDAMYTARRTGVEVGREVWDIQRTLMDVLESRWREPDHGIWEVRGEPRHFTYSKAMAWVAFDRAVKEVERFGLEGPVDRWRRARDAIHAEICARGFDASRGTFTQSYESPALDASLLRLALVGFLPGDDPRVRGTVEAIERELMNQGFVYRYTPGTDGIAGGEGTFLACSFWLVSALVLLGRQDEARRLFERLLATENDVGLLAEEYDPEARRFLGNFPQALSHVALVNAARALSGDVLSADRGERDGG
jgi:GH15 family glucan-1,4-alpha-glucosidase